MTNGTTYFYKVKAVNANGTSGYSNEASATPAVAVPSAPTGLSASAGNAQIVLTWTASSGATSYNVYRGTTAGGESTTAIATGVTGTTYTNTGLTNGTTYYYKMKAVNTSGTSGYSNEASATPAASSGSLSGVMTTISSAQTFNLTTLGTTDWAAWNNGFEHSTSGGSKISNVSAYGGGGLTSFYSGYLGFSWTNGTPDASVTNEQNGYYNSGGAGDGFTFTAPASTTMQTLTVFVGGWDTSGTLTATLSDGSAAPYSNTFAWNSFSGSYYAYYTLTYKAASAGKTLTVKWTAVSGGANVTIYAAALH